ncbi:protein kinase domain-containing protein [Pseudomonas orientalis]|uniref:protein kinase domain-containing protein n=1 Tax=Pseudomonas orientalis TaxID=76758 RepID=UPI003209BCB5
MEIKEIDAGGPPWKPNHDSIPLTWKHKGDGGNAHVWTDGTYAIKRLKPNASKEPVARFAREAQLLAGMAGNPKLAVVPIVDVRKRAGQIEIVMELLEGNLAEVIDEYQAQPEKAAKALLPIVETLAQLANRPQPVHHRDIKPENLLYKRRNSEISLALSDFGCAYLAEDERLTPTHRAIGAWAYRPPEYSIGRVANVDEKGDVFSLGKVFWAMVNGQRHVVFPGPVWFQEEFDLALLFPTIPKIHHAMVLIAQTCNIRSAERPTLAQFATNLRQLITPTTGEAFLSNDELTAAMLRKEARREIEYQQRRAFAAQFVCAIHADFLRGIEELHNGLPTSALFREWFDATQRSGQSQEALVNQVAEHESDAPVSNVFFQKTVLNTRFFPANGINAVRFVARIEDQTGRVPPSELIIYGGADGTTADFYLSDGTRASELYDSALMVTFLMNAAVQLP